MVRYVSRRTVRFAYRLTGARKDERRIEGICLLISWSDSLHQSVAILVRSSFVIGLVARPLARSHSHICGPSALIEARVGVGAKISETQWPIIDHQRASDGRNEQHSSYRNNRSAPLNGRPDPN